MKYSVATGLAISALMFGCSDEREDVPPLDGGADHDEVRDGAPSVDAPVDVGVDVARDRGPIDFFDVIPLPDAGCPGCVQSRCGSQINSCANNPVCAEGLLCTIQMCSGILTGDAGLSGANLTCVLGCFNNDLQLVFSALNTFTCITTTCGSACGLTPDAGSPRPDAPGTADADGAPPPVDVSVDGDFDGAPPPPDADPTEDAAQDAPVDVPSVDVTPDVASPDAGAPDAPTADVSDDALPDGSNDDAQTNDAPTNDTPTNDAADTPLDDAMSDATTDEASLR